MSGPQLIALTIIGIVFGLQMLRVWRSRRQWPGD